jgi:hypothetical protein
MEGMVLSARNCVVGASLNLQQLIAFRSLIDNAKAKLDGIRPKSGL